MARVIFSPLRLQREEFPGAGITGAALWVTALEMGLQVVEKRLPIDMVPPVGATNQGSDGQTILWRYQQQELKPLAYEIRTVGTVRGNARQERAYQAGGHGRDVEVTLDQRVETSRLKTLTRTEQLNGLPDGWAMNNELIVPHHSITVIKAATANASSKTVVATFGSALSLGNTLTWHGGYWYGNAGGTTFALSNTAGSYTVAVLQDCTAALGVAQAMGYRYATGSEGLAQTQVVTTTYTQQSTIYVAEVSGIRQTAPVDDTMSTLDGGDPGVTTRSSGTSGTLEATLEKYILFGYTTNAPITSRAYGNDDGVPPTEVNVNELTATWINTYTAQKIRTSTTAAGSTLTWTPAQRCGGIGMALAAEDSVAPGVVVPSYRTQTTSATTGAIAGVSAVEPGDPITSVTATCTSGDITVTASGSCTLTTNGTSTVVIENGASLAEFNATLASMLYQGDAAFHGKDTLTITASDGTLSDNDTLDVLNDPLTLTVTFSGTQAQGIAAIEATYATLVSGSSGTLTMLTTDSGALTDSDGITINEATDNPVITSNSGGATAALDVDSGGTYVTTVIATDPNTLPITYSLSGGVDQALFAIGSMTGILTFLTAANYQTPTDSDTNGIYLVTVRASNGTTYDEQALTITVTDAAPVITSNGGGPTASLLVASGQTAVTTVTATDVDVGETLTYSISGGVDAALFSIGSSTGVLTFDSAPDIDVPLDVGADNIYDVIVQVSDGIMTDTQALDITVVAGGAVVFKKNFTKYNAATRTGRRER